jgi:FKBP-type peptidyl-prolyl cis-trans isomerase 2
MSIVKEGYKVNIKFEAKLESGESVLKTEEGQPLEIVIGERTIPKAIEKAILNMKVGETKSIKLEPIEAFGPKLDNLVIDLPKEGFGHDCNLGIGEKVSLDSPDGKKFIGIIKEIKDTNITVDFNHPLAGERLVFTVTIVSIN